MNIFDLGQALDHFDPLSIASEKCLRNLSPMSTCQKCADICPTGGLSLEDGVWRYDNCINCGLCAYVCPQKVFGLDRKRLMSLRGQKVLLACEEMAEKIEGAVSVHCLQQFTFEEFAAFLAANEEVIIYLPEEACANCSKDFVLSGLLWLLDSLHLDHSKLTVLDSEEKLKQWQETQKQTANISRRNFLHQLSHRGKKSMQDIAAKTVSEAEKTLDAAIESLKDEPKTFQTAHVLSDRQMVLPLLNEPLAAMPYHLLQNNRCNFCTACVRLCPTGALKLEESDDGVKTLAFAPQLCHECDLCREICPEQGFYWDELKWEQLKSREPLTIAQAQAEICQKCGEEFWQYPLGDKICRFCRH